MKLCNGVHLKNNKRSISLKSYSQQFLGVAFVFGIMKPIYACAASYSDLNSQLL